MRFYSDLSRHFLAVCQIALNDMGLDLAVNLR